ncbi:MAG TPA: AhpC/TSA family protein [Kofleriaceae bacterium]|nr:AhpC/TSA family protein [Kofleriaceae bacterium]
MRWQIVYLLRDFVVAPHTFLRPKPRETAPRPELGAPAPALPALRPGRAAVVAFLRHVGCPFAEATVREMATLAAQHPAIDFIAVTHSPEQPSRRWCDAFGGAAGVQLVPDPDRTHYAAWGVGLSDREHFAGRASLTAVGRLLDQGIHNRWASGNRWQPAASFAVDAGGLVRWRHFPRHAGDLPPLGEAITTLTAASATGRPADHN